MFVPAQKLSTLPFPCWNDVVRGLTWHHSTICINYVSDEAVDILYSKYPLCEQFGSMTWEGKPKFITLIYNRHIRGRHMQIALENHIEQEEAYILWCNKVETAYDDFLKSLPRLDSTKFQINLRRINDRRN